MFIFVLLTEGAVFLFTRRDPARKEPVTSVANAELLCDHGGLLHRPSPDADTESK